MTHIYTQPKGSSIRVHDQRGQRMLSWKVGRPIEQGRWFIIAFICLWLVAWAVGEVTVFLRLKATIEKGLTSSWAAVPWGAVLYNSAWLGGWSLGGWAVTQALYVSFRKSRPESVRLGLEEFCYDPGVSASRRRRRSESRTKPWKCVVIVRRDMPEVVLDRAGDRQRLSFDLDADRIEIGKSLREPDREWLAQVIADWRGDGPG